jgi:hypothetical protein
MKTKRIPFRTSCFFPCILFIIISSHALDINGISVPDKIQADSDSLVLNGAGIRTKWGIKIYVGGLYLLKKKSDAESIIDADEPMAVRLYFVSGLVTSEKMSASTREGFTKSTNGNTAPMQNRIDGFIKIFTEKINKNDVYDLIYIPGHGTDVYKNGSYLSTTKGLDFKKALFGIWLCNKPAHKKLKECMLGK